MVTADQGPTRPLFPRRRLRLALAVPGALVAALAVTAGLSLYAPMGQVDRILLPVILFPFLFVGLFFFALMAPRVRWVGLVFALLILGHGALIARGFG
ncbi:hypothetical protein [Rhodothalassium salexigens]|uniref:hypothetical protein n=1 Tax=Rhodothalassium salexigens TaxID=1086 RepID=UPI0019114657|nr:hypothetical protein [Rhodothalassium salexigens]